MTNKKMQCFRCKVTVDVTLVRNITNAGTSLIYWQCEICKQNAGGSAHWLPHEPIKKYGIDIETIPVVKDGRSDPCEVCGELGSHWHHWAPRHLFGDEADNWPGAFLCLKHHEQWHKKVTPNMCEVKHEPL